MKLPRNSYVPEPRLNNELLTPPKNNGDPYRIVVGKTYKPKNAFAICTTTVEHEGFVDIGDGIWIKHRGRLKEVDGRIVIVWKSLMIWFVKITVS